MNVASIVHTVGPIGTAVFVVVLFGAPYVGLALVKRARARLAIDPKDARARRQLKLGVFLIQRGSHGRALAEEAAEYLPAAPRAIARFAFESLPEIELPPGSTATVESTTTITVETPADDKASK